MNWLVALACITIGVFLGTGTDCSAGITRPEEPQGGRQIAYDHLVHMFQSDPRFFGDFLPGDLSLVEPLQEYTVTKEKFALGNLLPGATFSNWSYVIMHGDKVLGHVDVKANGETGKMQWDGTSHTPTYDGSLVNAMHIAEQLPQVKERDYEARILGVPFGFLYVLWLHGKTDDILIPLLPVPHGVKAGQPYTESEIIKFLNEAAEARSKPQ